MTKLRAFVWGIREVRSDLTMHFDDLLLQDWYDRGRYLAARFVRREILR